MVFRGESCLCETLYRSTTHRSFRIPLEISEGPPAMLSFESRCHRLAALVGLACRRVRTSLLTELLHVAGSLETRTVGAREMMRVPRRAILFG